MTCKKCKSENLVMRPNAKNPTATELICADCGTWQKFISKEEIRVIEIHNKTKKTRITNADRIRGMSDEELAKTLAYGDVFYEEICGSDERTRVCDNDCMACALEWLQQPAKESVK